MATSGVYTVTVTAATIVEGALRTLGAVQEGNSPTSSEMLDGIEALNFLILQWQGPQSPLLHGMKMWQRERVSLALDITKNSYDLMPSGGDSDMQIPVEIIAAKLQNSDDVDVVLSPMTIAEYESIGTKSASQTPTAYYYEKRLDKGVLYLNGKPSDATDTIELTYRQPFELINAQTDELDMEPFYYRALKYNLAVDLSPEFGETPSTVIGLAQQSLEIAQSFYPETTDVYFQPERD